MTQMPELYVLRHGETEWNRAGRMQGSLDSPLTGRGRAQAARQAEILRREGVAMRGVVCHASPQGRAAETARLALGPLGLVATPDPRLAEIAIGRFEGRTTAENRAAWPETFRDARPFRWYFRTPDGESFEGFRGRIRAFLDDLSAPAVIVTHGITSRVLRGLALDLDVDAMFALPGGQGTVYHLRHGVHRTLTL